ncbi:MAG: hypothetical protein NVSMB7_05720 [Chitinophagaceae bacterium]
MRVIFFVLLTGLVAACTNGNTVPAGIIPSQEMETILWQLMQSDEYVNTQLAKDSLKKASTEKMKIYQQVFDLNRTSLDEFKKSYQYYMDHPDITKIMFDSITVRAARQRTDIYKSKPVAINIKPDSLTLKPPGKVKFKSKKAKNNLPVKAGKKP